MIRRYGHRSRLYHRKDKHEGYIGHYGTLLHRYHIGQDQLYWKKIIKFDMNLYLIWSFTWAWTWWGGSWCWSLIGRKKRLFKKKFFWITSKSQNTIGICITSARNSTTIIAQIRSWDWTNMKSFTTWIKWLFIINDLKINILINQII
jgi:hypothetical protein